MISHAIWIMEWTLILLTQLPLTHAHMVTATRFSRSDLPVARQASRLEDVLKQCLAFEQKKPYI